MFSSRVVIFILALFTVLVAARPVTVQPPSSDVEAVAPTADSVDPVPQVAEPRQVSAPKAAVPKIASALTSLFPLGTPGASWSTAQAADSPLNLNDATLRPQSALRSSPYTYTTAPDGSRAIKGHFNQGAYVFNKGSGFSFYAIGPKEVDLTDAKEMTFGYSVFFPKGFNFQLGGKLPGAGEYSFPSNHVFVLMSCQLVATLSLSLLAALAARVRTHAFLLA